MAFGFDWDGDGKVGDGDFFFTQHLLDEAGKGSSKNSGGGSCLGFLLVPVLIAGLILKVKGMV